MPTPTISRWKALWEQGQFEDQKAVLSIAPMLPDFGKRCPVTADQAIFAPSPSLATLKKYQSEDFMLASVERLIAMYAGLLNIGKNLQPFQVSVIAQEICTDYYYLTLCEIQFVLKQGVKGAYGKIYDRFDIEVVMGWFVGYSEERVAIASARSRDAHKATQEASNAVEAPAYISDFIRELEAKNEKRSVAEFTPDDHFWKMVDAEYCESENSLSLSQYRAKRLAEIKAVFSRQNKGK